MQDRNTWVIFVALRDVLRRLRWFQTVVLAIMQAAVSKQIEAQPGPAGSKMGDHRQTRQSVVSSLSLETYIDMQMALCKGSSEVQKAPLVERAMYKMNDLKQVSGLDIVLSLIRQLCLIIPVRSELFIGDSDCRCF